ncbi:MAG TPA: methyltransferase domain-containing protein [Fimbriimonadaceae bacterium]|nr:methyltransferase domain-containing protein [Fimbriimonadaceae bacterium]
MTDWNAAQYEKFQQERSQPAYDLMDLIGPRNSMRIVDLGCGTGEHTKTLHERFRSVETIGIDTSEQMLLKAPRAVGLKFYNADIAEFGGDSEFDLIFSNAALHWLPDHQELFTRFRKALRPGGQVAVQMPKNRDHPAPSVAYALEREPPYNQYPPCPIDKNVLAPEAYMTLLHRLGFRSIKVRLYVYLHELASGADTVEWLKGSMLTHYRATQPPEVYSLFEREFTNRIERSLGEERPYPFTYKRVFIHAVR